MSSAFSWALDMFVQVTIPHVGVSQGTCTSRLPQSSPSCCVYSVRKVVVSLFAEADVVVSDASSFSSPAFCPQVLQVPPHSSGPSALRSSHRHLSPDVTCVILTLLTSDWSLPPALIYSPEAFKRQPKMFAPNKIEWIFSCLKIFNGILPLVLGVKRLL